MPENDFLVLRDELNESDDTDPSLSSLSISVLPAAVPLTTADNLFPPAGGGGGGVANWLPITDEDEDGGGLLRVPALEELRECREVTPPPPLVLVLEGSRLFAALMPTPTLSLAAEELREVCRTAAGAADGRAALTWAA